LRLFGLVVQSVPVHKAVMVEQLTELHQNLALAAVAATQVQAVTVHLTQVAQAVQELQAQ
jgi:hypothetical protein